MARSNNSVRENKAMQSILRGESPEKRIFVAMGNKKEKEERQKQITKERAESSERSDALKAARTPWFCPECKKVMKKRLDDKMYRLYSHCFDCQLKIENKMRIDGTYDDWEKEKVKANRVSWIKDQRISIEEFKEQKTPEYYNQVNPDGYSIDKEKWDMDMSLVMKQADEALEHLQKMEDSLK